MTPFGNVLSQLRRSRKLQQKELAERIAVQPCYISAIEGGKKGPPSKIVLQSIIETLELSPEESHSLKSAIEPSERVFRVPDNISLEEYAFLWVLRQRLGSLSGEELAIMTNALRLGSISR
ncbi:MAG TPA: helix-turn-helix transcriptional regulator [Cellvibrio sp.]